MGMISPELATGACRSARSLSAAAWSRWPRPGGRVPPRGPRRAVLRRDADPPPRASPRRHPPATFRPQRPVADSRCRPRRHCPLRRGGTARRLVGRGIRKRGAADAPAGQRDATQDIASQARSPSATCRPDWQAASRLSPHRLLPARLRPGCDGARAWPFCCCAGFRPCC